MYAEHVPIIKYGTENDLPTFRRAIMFAVLSARTQFNRVPQQCKETERLKSGSPHLWGWKFDSYNYVYGETVYSLWGEMCSAALHRDTPRAMWAITRVPGIGLAKGAFVCQMMGHDIACIDARNILADGRPARQYRADGESRKAMPSFRRKIDRYIQDTGGRAEFYWNRWCETVGPDYGMTSEECSRLHVVTIVGKRMRALYKAHVETITLPF